jgi:hypothetical protein
MNIPNEVWCLEYRCRDRKNGKWSEWEQVDHRSSAVSAYLILPDEMIIKQDKFERRAVLYKRQPEAH